MDVDLCRDCCYYLLDLANKEKLMKFHWGEFLLGAIAVAVIYNAGILVIVLLILGESK